MSPLGDPAASEDGHEFLRVTAEARRIFKRAKRDVETELERARALQPKHQRGLVPVDLMVLLAYDLLLDADELSEATPRRQAPTAQRIAELTGYDDTDVNLAIKRLQKLGLIELVPDPYPRGYRRGHLYRLTDDGRFMLAELWPRRF